jgi:hypothetical protein
MGVGDVGRGVVEKDNLQYACLGGEFVMPMHVGSESRVGQSAKRREEERYSTGMQS